MTTKQVKQQPDKSESRSMAGLATTLVQCSAALLLGGGFYYGIAKQKKMVRDEKLLLETKHANKDAPVIRKTTFLERRLGLDRAQTPNAAAWKALVGGTIVSVSGCVVLLGGLSAVLGVRSLGEFRERMEDYFPRMRRGVTSALHIKPKERVVDSEAEEEELRQLAAIFEEAAVSPAASASNQQGKKGI